MNKHIENLMNTKETAEYLNVSLSKLYRMVENKELPYIKLGGKYLFRKSSINNYLEEIENTLICEEV